jgi:hypothetical protein
VPWTHEADLTSEEWGISPGTRPSPTASWGKARGDSKPDNGLASPSVRSPTTLSSTKHRRGPGEMHTTQRPRWRHRRCSQRSRSSYPSASRRPWTSAASSRTSAASSPRTPSSTASSRPAASCSARRASTAPPSATAAPTASRASATGCARPARRCRRT